jgi:hypothetical protein
MAWQIDNVSKRTIGLLGFLGGVILILIILGIVHWREGRFNWGPGMMDNLNQSGYNQNVYWRSPRGGFGQMGMMGRGNYFYDDFDQLQWDMNQMRQRMWDDFSQFPPVDFSAVQNQSAGAAQSNNGQVQNEFSGKMSFMLNGSQFELPYAVKDKALKLDLTSLKNFMQANPGQKITFKLMGPGGQIVNQFSKVEDLKSPELTYDYQPNSRYLLNLQVTNDQGVVSLNMSQEI